MFRRITAVLGAVALITVLATQTASAHSTRHGATGNACWFFTGKSSTADLTMDGAAAFVTYHGLDEPSTYTPWGQLTLKQQTRWIDGAVAALSDACGFTAPTPRSTWTLTGAEYRALGAATYQGYHSKDAARSYAPYMSLTATTQIRWMNAGLEALHVASARHCKPRAGGHRPPRCFFLRG